ncbi:MAG: chemotaxis protein CheB [Alphaproteobacteria bacterium]|nr:MAG: chemotaxis protein CheB [Alphaproteobacteria bacterium]
MRQSRRQPLPNRQSARSPRQTVAVPTRLPSRPAPPQNAAPIRLTPWPPRQAPAIIGIGSSTGGPQALFEVFKALAPGLHVPVVITQHMPPTFTAILADHLARQTNLPCKEAADREVLRPGHIYVAPGDHHLLVEKKGHDAVARVVQTPPENFCRPAVDPMFCSLAKAFGERVLCIVLTGMGQDGTLGARDIIAHGGALVAQDEATSVVWGMPGSVAKAGLCNAVLPLQDIGPTLHGLLTGGAS